MLSRLNLLTRHLSRPFNPTRPSIPALSTTPLAPRPVPSAMTSAAHAKPIHTAACLIIGDEVLGGKVIQSSYWNQRQSTLTGVMPLADHRHQLAVPSQVLLLVGNATAEDRGHPR